MWTVFLALVWCLTSEAFSLFFKPKLFSNTWPLKSLSETAASVIKSTKSRAPNLKFMDTFWKSATTFNCKSPRRIAGMRAVNLQRTEQVCVTGTSRWSEVTVWDKDNKEKQRSNGSSETMKHDGQILISENTSIGLLCTIFHLTSTPAKNNGSEA